MAEKETENHNSEDNFIYRRNSYVLNQPVYHFKHEDLHLILNILKELHPEINCGDYSYVIKIIKDELDIEINEYDLERYYSPSIEGIRDEYIYKLKMYEDEYN